MRRVETFAIAVAAVAASLAAPAIAQPSSLSMRNEPLDVDVGLKAGVNGWTGDLGDRTAIGQFAGVEATKNFGRNLGVEASYESSRNLIADDDRVSAGAGLWRHNVSAGAKLRAYATDRLKPFAAAGVGVSYINPNERAEGAYQNDFITEVPLSAGVDYLMGGAFTLGARATYRLVGGEEFTNPSAGEDTAGGLMSVGVRLAGRF